MSNSFVTIAQFPSEIEAKLLADRLLEAGFHPRLANDQLQRALGTVYAYTNSVWVQVPEEEASNAQEIAATKLPTLSENQERDLEAEADALAVCPACGAEGVDYAETNGGIAGTCSACGHRWTLE